VPVHLIHSVRSSALSFPAWRQRYHYDSSLFKSGAARLSLLRLLERSFAYCTRFAIATQNLGFRNAIRVFSSIRGGIELRSIYVPRLQRTIFYRSAADRGAMAHFFIPGTRIVDNPVHPVRVIVDAGANIGVETIRMRHFHPQARVLAIEPSSGNYDVLHENVKQDEKWVETIPRGVWSTETGIRVLAGDTNEGFSVRPIEPGETADLEAITMNAILERAGGEIDILKMDIEGSEYEVFLHNTEWVNHVKVFIFECPDRDHPGAALQIFRTLAHLPLDTFISGGENLVLIRRDTGWKLETTLYL
jgi:FkbM family methyltransferase